MATGSKEDVMPRILALDASIREQAMLAYYHARNETPAPETYPIPMPLALSEATANAPTAGGGSGATPREVRADRGEKYALPPFTFFQDPGSEDGTSCVCVNPVVVVGGERIDVEEPGDGYSIGASGYFCHVYCQTGEWKAKIDDEEECELGDPDTRVCVPIVEIPADTSEPLKQLHTGAIVLDFDGKALASFSVYADDGVLKMYNPLVSCPPDTSLVPTGEISSLSSGTYYCHVLRDDFGESYSALIDTNQTASETGKKAVLDVKICDIGEDSEGNPFLETQYHVGVICADARPSGWFAVDGKAITSGEAGETVSRVFGFDIAQSILDKLNAQAVFEEKGRDGGVIKITEVSGSESSGSESSGSESSSSTPELEFIKEITGAEIKDNKLVLKVRKVRIKAPYEEDSDSTSIDLVPVGKHSCCEEE